MKRKQEEQEDEKEGWSCIAHPEWHFLHEQRGSGAQGTIYVVCQKKGQLDKDCRYVAKIFKQGDEWKHEVTVYGMLNKTSEKSKVAPRMLDAFMCNEREEEEKYVMILENAGETILSFVGKHGLAARPALFKQTARRLQVMHGFYHIYHRDLHVGNIMVDENERVELIDFGMATRDVFYRENDWNDLYNMGITIYGLSDREAREILSEYMPYLTKLKEWERGNRKRSILYTLMQLEGLIEVSPLQLMYDQIGVTHNYDPSNFDSILETRLLIKPTILPRLLQYKVRESDLEDPYLIPLINLTPGPIVLPSPGRGFGLFADKDYPKNSFLTVYGGEKGSPDKQGGYVVYDEKKKETIDGLYGFYLHEKGRWVNEYGKTEQERFGRTNTRLYRNPQTQQLAFRTIGAAVMQGEEFYWDYGDYYDRSSYY